MAVQRAFRTTSFIMASTVVLIALLILTGLIVDSRARDLADQSSLSEDFQLKTRSVAVNMSDMETAVRGYVLTGQDDFLDPYNAAVGALPRLWSALASEAEYIDGQSIETQSIETQTLVSLLATMKGNADTWRASFAEPTINLRRSGDTGAATVAVQSGTGKALFDAYRTTSALVDRHIQDHVVAYRNDVGAISNVRLGLLLGLSVLALGNAIFAVRLMQRDRRLHAEAFEQAEAERERLETLIENLPVAVQLVSAPNGNIVIQNRLSAELSPTEEWNRLSPEERVSHFFLSLPDGEPLTGDQFPAMRTLREGVTITDFEIVIHAPDTKPRVLLVSTAPLRDMFGRISGAVVVTQDVTRAKALDQRKDEFIATAAHELRNPLTALSGHYQLLMKLGGYGDLDPAVRRHFVGIGKQIRRVNGLIERLLDASRIELGRLVLQRTSFDLVKLAQSAVDDAETAGGDQHNVSLDMSENQILGTWDEMRVSQAMANLLSNAARYSPPGTAITLCLRTSPREVRVEVRDQGPGVPEQLRPSLFNRYYQAHNNHEGSTENSPHHPSQPSVRGLGLGLYITAEIVKAHRGDIGVDPNPGGGSIFWFTLPR